MLRVKRRRYLPHPVFLLFILCMVGGHLMLCEAKVDDGMNQSPEGVPKSTKILITTSGAGATDLKHRQVSNPPRLIVDFFSKNVVTNIPVRSIVNRGVIKEIRAEYYADGKDTEVLNTGGRALKSLIFDLVELTPYQVITEGNAVLIIIENPTVAAGMGLPIGAMEIAPPEPDQQFVALTQKDKALLETLEAEELKIAGVDVGSDVLKTRIARVMQTTRDAQDVQQPLAAADAGFSPVSSPSDPSAAAEAKTSAEGTRQTVYTPPPMTRWFPEQATTIPSIGWLTAVPHSRIFVRWFISFCALILGFVVGAYLWHWRKRYIELGIARIEELTGEIERIQRQHKAKTSQLEEEILRRLRLEGELAERNLALDREQQRRKEMEEEIARRTKREKKLAEAINRIEEELHVRDKELSELLNTQPSKEKTAAGFTETRYALDSTALSREQNYAGPERRRWPRIDIPDGADTQYGVTFRGWDEGQNTSFESRINNLSQRGCSFEISRDAVIPQTFSGELLLGTETDPIRLSAKTIWNKDNKDPGESGGGRRAYGLYFEDISDNDQIAIAQYIEEETSTSQGGVSVSTMSAVLEPPQELQREIETKKRPVLFRVFAPEAAAVALLCSSNGWVAPFSLEKNDEGWWETKIELEPGKYEYGFSIDGVWESDPECPTKMPNNFGGYNSVMDVEEDYGAKIVKFRLFMPHANQVFLAGNFNNWNTMSHPLKRAGDGWWQVHLLLLSGVYRYKFFADGRWITDPDCTSREPNEFGGEDCIIEVD
ncbi:MAG: PilZ domain-containing protein [Candidatus Omnitrophica bacterium]|nr:PilZ domain-containing protein [Candidatus Omnitrophota bacterium]